MSFTTLTKTVTATVPNSGTVTLTLKPDVGQYWAPFIVRVALTTISVTNPAAAGVPSSAQCTLYHGSPGVAAQQSQYIDDTSSAAGDSSSVISGTSVGFGEAIIAVFTNAPNNAIASITVNGLVSDQPPNVDVPPGIPGTRFAGHPQAQLNISQDLFAGQGSFTLSPNSGALANILDVRNLSSYYLQVHALTPNLATAMNACEIQITWFPDAAGAFNPLYVDTIAIWCDQLSAGGLFDCLATYLYAQDNHHGPYIQIGFFAPASNAQTISITGQLFSSSRILTGPYVRQLTTTDDSGQGSGIDGILVAATNHAIANGVVQNYPCAIGEGQAFYRFTAGAGALAFFLRYAGMAGAIETVNLALNTTVQEQPFTLPKRALLVSPRNLSGVASTVSVFVKTQFTKS